MDPSVCEYLTAKALQDIREGQELPDEVATFVNSYPSIDVLRGYLREDDLESVLRLAGSPSAGRRGLGYSLLRGFESVIAAGFPAL